jgi:uncharacterized protein YbbK (DUF523 family)
MTGNEPEADSIVKPLVGISSCLLGENVRYNGEIRLNKTLVNELGKVVSFVSVCPEVESGMSVPREPMDLFVANGVIRMITLESRRDMTELVTTWAAEKLNRLSELNLCGFILKARSPSCAISSARVHSEQQLKSNGAGLFASALKQRFPELPVEEEEGLKTVAQRERFLQRVFRLHGIRRQ